MLVETRKETPLTVMGYDIGTKYEGIVVVSGTENALAVKLDLPNKGNVVKKMLERKRMRRVRRQRNCGRRPERLNKSRKPFIAPSQMSIVGSRLKVLGACFKIYPITVVGNEDIIFNEGNHKYSSTFSTMIFGKKKIKSFFEDAGATVFNFRGYETEIIRNKYAYNKTLSKSVDKFDAHCSDALALACEVGVGVRVDPGQLIVVDDTYRPVRRQLHDANFSKGGIRENYSRGIVLGLRKGLLIGTTLGKIGQLCGIYNGKYRYYKEGKKRGESIKLSWVSSQFITRKAASVKQDNI